MGDDNGFWHQVGQGLHNTAFVIAWIVAIYESCKLEILYNVNDSSHSQMLYTIWIWLMNVYIIFTKSKNV